MDWLPGVTQLSPDQAQSFVCVTVFVNISFICLFILENWPLCDLKPEPIKCKRKGDSEQLLQDFTQFKEKMELFFTAAQVVGAHTGDPPTQFATPAGRRRP